MDIRNIAIIAHVDHGKTTLTDALLRQTGMVDDAAFTMDSNSLEKERGITIYAKNASLRYKDTKVNLVDTPGHADFGSEVERVLRAIDCVLLVVDAQEGPMPQTKFVLKKSLELGIKPIVVINKIDKPAARPDEVHEMVLELFMDLGATDEQMDFPYVYAIGRDGVAMRKLDDERKNLDPLLDVILEHVPPADAVVDVPVRFQPFNLGYDNFLGRLAIGRVYEGTLTTGSQVVVKTADGAERAGKIVKLFTFEGLARNEATIATAGDIVTVAGIADIDIGETICANKDQQPLPAITVDEPTISLQFMVNSSPFAGKEGKFVTTRQIRERLERELQINVGLKIDFSNADAFTVYGRGEMHVSILIENMRREGYELSVSQPQVIIREENGKKMEPFEEVVIDTPDEFVGAIIEKLGKRRGSMTQMQPAHGLTRLVFEVPTRGLLGYRGEFVTDTKGEGIMSSRVVGFREHAGEITARERGSMISQEAGTVRSYALETLQDRGRLYVGPNVEVYEGMVIGDVSKGNDMTVNPVKAKQLSNMRSKGDGESTALTPPIEMTIERGLELMSGDELLEITPLNVRLRKRVLKESERVRSGRKG